MIKRRLIPVLLLKNGWLVQSKLFSQYLNLGNPITATKRLSEWVSDELIFLDISKDEVYDLRRDDLGHPNRHSMLEILDDVSKNTFMPITVGGKIKTISDIEIRLAKGADKISINTKALDDREFISDAAKEFGSQCIVVSIDAKKIGNRYYVMRNGGKEKTKYTASQWSKIVESQGAGEILINSIDRDGTKQGYDIALVRSVSEAVSIPVIALGGAGQWDHFLEVFKKTKVSAVAAANVFQHVDQSVYLAKKYLYDNNVKVRSPELIFIN